MVVDTVQDVSYGHVNIKASSISGISPLYGNNGEIVIDKED